jgi:hypothetical protein
MLSWSADTGGSWWALLDAALVLALPWELLLVLLLLLVASLTQLRSSGCAAYGSSGQKA